MKCERRIFGFAGVALLVSALFDAAVAVAHMAGVPHWQPWMVSAEFACMLAMLGALELQSRVPPGHRQITQRVAGRGDEGLNIR